MRDELLPLLIAFPHRLDFNHQLRVWNWSSPVSIFIKKVIYEAYAFEDDDVNLFIGFIPCGVSACLSLLFICFVLPAEGCFSLLLLLSSFLNFWRSNSYGSLLFSLPWTPDIAFLTTLDDPFNVLLKAILEISFDPINLWFTLSLIFYFYINWKAYSYFLNLRHQFLMFL